MIIIIVIIISIIMGIMIIVINLFIFIRVTTIITCLGNSFRKARSQREVRQRACTHFRFAVTDRLTNSLLFLSLLLLLFSVLPALVMCY